MTHREDCPERTRVVDGDRKCCACNPCGTMDCPKKSGRWSLLLDARMVGGHRYWVEAGLGHEQTIAVSDDSGANPDETEDGVLYLMTNLPIFVGKGGHIGIPLHGPKGQPWGMSAGFGEALMVSECFGMMIKVATWEGDSQQFAPARKF